MDISADLIDRLNNVKTDVNDYFVIVDAVNAITALRNRLKELSEDIGLQRDDAWDEGYAHGYNTALEKKTDENRHQRDDT